MPNKPLRLTKASIWEMYVRLMRAASQAALDFADALEAYLHRGVDAPPGRAFDKACATAAIYSAAVAEAQPYHFGLIPSHGAGLVINASADELLEVMRELRGTAISRSVRGPDGRAVAGFVYADDGIAGYFRVELRSMRLFKRPRRDPLAKAA